LEELPGRNRTSADREHEHNLPLAGEREPLILRRAGTATRINALFKRMATDVELRERFIKDPAQVLTEYVESKPLPPQQASVTNQLLYSVLSNQKSTVASVQAGAECSVP
jgi:hypothetical protein